jgi:hypothetical protein
MASAPEHGDDPVMTSRHAPTPIRSTLGVGSAPDTLGGAGGKDIEQAITVLRARIDEEFRIAERLDSKSRQVFALAAGFFAVVQTVAFGSFAQNRITSTDRMIMLIATVIAGLALVAVAYRLSRGETLLPESDIKPEAILAWCNESESDAEHVSTHLVGELSRVARCRSDNNEIRSRNYDAVATMASVALSLAGLELLIAIAVRV